MDNFKRLVILLPFFGKFPWYFPYFLHSCKFNPTIDFIVITDNKQKFNGVSDNVFFLQKKIKDLERAASKKLGFRVVIPYPYKVCDIRPTFGFLFPELIKKYSFWGYGDIDVIYGDLRHFLTKNLLHNYDVISFRPEYLTGSLTIWRNSEKINTLFMHSKDYQMILSSATYFNFDECNFLFGPLQAGKNISSIASEIDSMTHVVKERHSEGCLNAYFDFHLVEGSTGKVKWENGKIIYGNKLEAALYHFLKFKENCKTKKNLAKNSEPIYISQSTIYKKYSKNL